MIRIGMGTTCVYPLGVETAFRTASELGFDGVEVMVTRDETTQSVRALRALAERQGTRVLSIHAPVLLLTHFVWGRDPRVKLERSAELAAELGADTVVVHPPFRWQSGYAEDFLDIVRATASSTGVVVAVENMFPWKVAGRSMAGYVPHWNPVGMDCDAVTLDFSHAALSGVDGLELADALGSRLRHVHLCDGSGALDDSRVFDEHLVPGRGSQPVAAVLRSLAASGWSGSIVAEVNTRKARDAADRRAMLQETLSFAYAHTSGIDQGGPDETATPPATAPAPAAAPARSSIVRSPLRSGGRRRSR
ncbi:sugar phosphate isomerase/epimerase [Leifsonia shinshuensis]|uniref:sugar phosphate isomerase/epimerase family protein n=1 Tax=Leifsonia shinshuensis TaxID=150026 RepID=UPI001F5045BF|nr:sugar phosphate isomerase/epimerase [Leifsonia shinshuensis]MCI0155143.1 sugar phosphate isomerase/epimerase [Leifsonia shinshuensis]